jgi:hypothetical protein
MSRVGESREMRKHVIIPSVVVPTTRYHIAAGPRPAWQMYAIAASVALNISLLTAIAYYLLH